MTYRRSASLSFEVSLQRKGETDWVDYRAETVSPKDELRLLVRPSGPVWFYAVSPNNDRLFLLYPSRTHPEAQITQLTTVPGESGFLLDSGGEKVEIWIAASANPHSMLDNLARETLGSSSDEIIGKQTTELWSSAQTGTIGTPIKVGTELSLVRFAWKIGHP